MHAFFILKTVYINNCLPFTSNKINMKTRFPAWPSLIPNAPLLSTLNISQAQRENQTIAPQSSHWPLLHQALVTAPDQSCRSAKQTSVCNFEMSSPWTLSQFCKPNI